MISHINMILISHTNFLLKSWQKEKRRTFNKITAHTNFLLIMALYDGNCATSLLATV